MTLLIDYQAEIRNEILGVLSNQVKRYHACQTTSKAIHETIKRRFGFNWTESSSLANMVIKDLEVSKILVFSHSLTRDKIYNISPAALEKT